MSLSGENTSTFVQLKIKLDKRSRDLQKEISKKQIGHLGRCIFWTLTSTAYKTDLQCLFKEYSSKREIHNNMNHTNIKYPRCNMDCHLCGERHGSGADELLERLEGTQRAQRCALKRFTNQFCGQTFVRMANCRLPGFVLWSSHHHCERLPKMQFAKCCWR